MDVRLLLELCDHDHELLNYQTVVHAVDCSCISFNAVQIIEVSRGGSVRMEAYTSVSEMNQSNQQQY